MPRKNDKLICYLLFVDFLHISHLFCIYSFISCKEVSPQWEGRAVTSPPSLMSTLTHVGFTEILWAVIWLFWSMPWDGVSVNNLWYIVACIRFIDRASCIVAPVTLWLSVTPEWNKVPDNAFCSLTIYTNTSILQQLSSSRYKTWRHHVHYLPVTLPDRSGH